MNFRLYFLLYTWISPVDAPSPISAQVSFDVLLYPTGASTSCSATVPEYFRLSKIIFPSESAEAVPKRLSSVIDNDIYSSAVKYFSRTFLINSSSFEPAPEKLYTGIFIPIPSSGSFVLPQCPGFSPAIIAFA